MTKLSLSSLALLLSLNACGSGNDTSFSGAAGASGSAATAGSSGNAGAGATAGSGTGGGNAGSAGTSTGGSAGSATSGGAAGTGDAGASSGGTAGIGTAGSGAAGNGGTAGASCPDVFGSYTISDAQGTCGTLNKDATQSIQGTTSVCALHFVSEGSATNGVNGGASLQSDGTFAGTMLYLDITQRSPCSGTWNATESTMTVMCGGTGDRCTVVLKRN